MKWTPFVRVFDSWDLSCLKRFFSAKPSGVWNDFCARKDFFFLEKKQILRGTRRSALTDEVICREVAFLSLNAQRITQAGSFSKKFFFCSDILNITQVGQKQRKPLERKRSQLVPDMFAKVLARNVYFASRAALNSSTAVLIVSYCTRP